MPICHLFSHLSPPGFTSVLCVPLCGCTVFSSFPSSIPFTGFQKESRQPLLSFHLPRVHMRCCCKLVLGDAKVHQSINWYSEKGSLGGLSSKYPANRNMPMERLFSLPLDVHRLLLLAIPLITLKIQIRLLDQYLHEFLSFPASM